MYETETESKLVSPSCDVPSKQIGADLESNVLSRRDEEYISSRKVNEPVTFQNLEYCQDNTSISLEDINNGKISPHRVDTSKNEIAVHVEKSIVLDEIVPSSECQFVECTENGCNISSEAISKKSHVDSSVIPNSCVKECLTKSSLHSQDTHVITGLHDTKDTACCEVNTDNEKVHLEIPLTAMDQPESLKSNDLGQCTINNESGIVPENCDLENLPSKQIGADLESNVLSRRDEEYVSSRKVNEPVTFQNLEYCQDNTSISLEDINNGKISPHRVDTSKNGIAVHVEKSIVLDEIVPSSECQFVECTENGCNISSEAISKKSHVDSSVIPNSCVKECLTKSSLHSQDTHVITGLHDTKDTACCEVNTDNEKVHLEIPLTAMDQPESLKSNDLGQCTINNESGIVPENCDLENVLPKISVPTTPENSKRINRVDKYSITNNLASMPKKISLETEFKEILAYTPDIPQNSECTDLEKSRINNNSNAVMTNFYPKNKICDIPGCLTSSPQKRQTVDSKISSPFEIIDLEINDPENLEPRTDICDTLKSINGKKGVTDDKRDHIPELLVSKNTVPDTTVSTVARRNLRKCTIVNRAGSTPEIIDLRNETPEFPVTRSNLGKCTTINKTGSIPEIIDLENETQESPVLICDKENCLKLSCSNIDIMNSSVPKIITPKIEDNNIPDLTISIPGSSKFSVLEEKGLTTDSSNLISSKPSVENYRLTEKKESILEVKEKSQDFVSENPCENDDNDNPEWELLKKLDTDEERYKAVRNRWRNLSIPDPNKNLTHIHIKSCFKHPRICFKKEMNKNEVSSRKRTLSCDSSAPDHAPVKRARTRSCTTSYDLKVQNHKRMIEEEERKLILEKKKALVQSRSEYNKEWCRLMSSQLQYYNYREFQTRLSILHNNQIQVVDSLKRQFDGALNKLEDEDRKKTLMFRNSMKEVEAFHKFYRKLDEEKSRNDCFFLTEAELDDVFETDKLYEKFNTFYS